MAAAKPKAQKADIQAATADPSQADAGEAAGKAVQLTISAKAEGFRRCGLAFGRQPVAVVVSAAQAEILRAEPMLDVSAS